MYNIHCFYLSLGIYNVNIKITVWKFNIRANILLKTIKGKLIFLVGILVIYIIFIGISSSRFLKEVNNKSTIISDNIIPGILYSEEINYEILAFRNLEYQHIIDENSATMLEKEKALNEQIKEIQDDFDKLFSYKLNSIKSTV